MHVIRLRGPWQVVSLDAAGEPVGVARRVFLPPESREHERPGENLDHGTTPVADAPGSSLDSEAISHLRFERWFNWPGKLDAGVRLWLVIEPLAGRASISLNDRPLPECATGATGYSAEISTLVQQRNRLLCDVMLDTSSSAAAFGEVRLEVRS